MDNDIPDRTFNPRRPGGWAPGYNLKAAGVLPAYIKRMAEEADAVLKASNGRLRARHWMMRKLRD